MYLASVHISVDLADNSEYMRLRPLRPRSRNDKSKTVTISSLTLRQSQEKGKRSLDSVQEVEDCSIISRAVESSRSSQLSLQGGGLPGDL